MISIAISSWFSFYKNALSDLGNVALHMSTAWVFNIGLILAGLLVVSFAILVSVPRFSWKYLIWTAPLGSSGTALVLIGLIPENAGKLHGVVSTLFFVLAGITLLLYSYASWPLGSPRVGALALTFGIAFPIVWLFNWPWQGVAIQEASTSAMAGLWLITVSLRNV